MLHKKFCIWRIPYKAGMRKKILKNGMPWMRVFILVLLLNIFLNMMNLLILLMNRKILKKIKMLKNIMNILIILKSIISIKTCKHTLMLIKKLSLKKNIELIEVHGLSIRLKIMVENIINSWILLWLKMKLKMLKLQKINLVRKIINI